MFARHVHNLTGASPWTVAPPSSASTTPCPPARPSPSTPDSPNHLTNPATSATLSLSHYGAQMEWWQLKLVFLGGMFGLCLRLSRPEALALPLFSVPIYGGMFQESGLSEAEVACQTMSLGRHELFRSSGWHNKAELSLTKRPLGSGSNVSDNVVRQLYEHKCILCQPFYVTHTIPDIILQF